MKQKLSNCIQNTTNNIRLKENKLSFRLINRSKKSIFYIYLDKCCIENKIEQKACDMVLKFDRDVMYIELKSKDIKGGTKQIDKSIESMKCIGFHEIDMTVYIVIIYRKMSANMTFLQLYMKRKKKKYKEKVKFIIEKEKYEMEL